MRLLLQRHHFLAELVALRLELARVEEHAVPLHLQEHGHHRHLDRLVDELQLFVRGNPRVERIVDRQRAVGVLGRVLGGALHVDLRKRDPRGALAGDRVVTDRLPAQVPPGEGLEVVPLVHLEHIRFEQRVVGNPAQGNAVVGEDVRVEFEVLADLGALVALNPGLEDLQRPCDTDLVGRACVAMRYRHVERSIVERERQPDEVGYHRLEPVGLGVEPHHRRRFQPQGQGAQPRLVDDHCIAAACGVHGRRCLHGRCRGRAEIPSDCGRGTLGRLAVQFLQAALEPEAREQFAKFRRIVEVLVQVLERERQFAVALHGEQPARLGQPLERLAQVLADHAADVVGVRHHGVEGPVLLDPFRRGLRPHLRHARDVVHRVTDQRVVVDDQFRRHAELLLHALDVELLVGHGVDQRHALIHQLGEVLVPGRDHAVHPGRFGPLGKGRDHVVGLHAIHADHRPAHRHDRFLEGLDLHDQVFGHRRALRLVFRVGVVAKGLGLGVEYASARFRLVVLRQPP